MAGQPGPFEYWRLGVTTGMMLVEAQTVIAYRMFGMAGLWPVARSENMRMVTEKPTTFARAQAAAFGAMMAQAGPVAVAEAALAPVHSAARANARRLARRRRK